MPAAARHGTHSSLHSCKAESLHFELCSECQAQCLDRTDVCRLPTGFERLACCHCAENGGELAGLVKESAAWLVPYSAHIIGGPTSHTPASGLVAALASEDWHTRRAAALALKALVTALGPRLDAGQVRLPNAYGGVNPKT